MATTQKNFGRVCHFGFFQNPEKITGGLYIYSKNFFKKSLGVCLYLDITLLLKK
jgi:hypothetical protein